MLIRLRQINLDDFKKIFMEKENYTINVSNVEGLHPTALTGDAVTVSGYSVNNESISKTIWTGSKVYTELKTLNDDFENKLSEKAETRITDQISGKVDVIEVKVESKANKLEFESIQDEVIKARKGQISLLAKIDELDTKLDNIIQSYSPEGKNIPVGGIIWYAGTEAPTSFAICDGRAVSRNKYDELFSAITTMYGEGDGTTTFNIPNLLGDTNFVRSSGLNYTVSSVQKENIIDVRESYEGSNMTDKLYLIGGKYFTKNAMFEASPTNITFIPCIKMEVNDKTDLPVGMVAWSASKTLTDDYLICDGRALSRNKFEELFNIIGTTYGVGDGSTTFNLPDLVSNNRFIKANKTCGKIQDNEITLTDVREAYEGDYNEDNLYPLGGGYFSSQENDSELIPSSIAFVPTIKVKTNIISNGFNIGSFVWYTDTTSPAGYLVCDGREVSRSTYSALYKKIGTTYGAGNGVSTFNLPDLITDNRFIRSYGGSIKLGEVSSVSLHDVRDAYEGDYNTNKLYPLGASYFESDSTFIELHPNNMALLPCIKAENVEKIDVASTISEITNQLDMMSADLRFNNSRSIETPFKVMNINVTLFEGKQNVTVNFNELEVEKISSAFVNVTTTSLGDEYVCDIISNVVIKDKYLVVYFKSLTDKLNSETLKATLNILI